MKYTICVEIKQNLLQEKPQSHKSSQKLSLPQLSANTFPIFTPLSEAVLEILSLKCPWLGSAGHLCVLKWLPASASHGPVDTEEEPAAAQGHSPWNVGEDTPSCFYELMF